MRLLISLLCLATAILASSSEEEDDDGQVGMTFAHGHVRIIHTDPGRIYSDHHHHDRGLHIDHIEHHHILRAPAPGSANPSFNNAGAASQDPPNFSPSSSQMLGDMQYIQPEQVAQALLYAQARQIQEGSQPDRDENSPTVGLAMWSVPRISQANDAQRTTPIIGSYQQAPARVGAYYQPASPNVGAYYQQAPPKVGAYQQDPSKVGAYEQAPPKVGAYYQQDPPKVGAYQQAPPNVGAYYQQDPPKVGAYQQPPPNVGAYYQQDSPKVGAYYQPASPNVGAYYQQAPPIVGAYYQQAPPPNVGAYQQAPVTGKSKSSDQSQRSQIVVQPASTMGNEQNQKVGAVHHVLYGVPVAGYGYGVHGQSVYGGHGGGYVSPGVYGGHGGGYGSQGVYGGHGGGYGSQGVYSGHGGGYGRPGVYSGHGGGYGSPGGYGAHGAAYCPPSHHYLRLPQTKLTSMQLDSDPIVGDAMADAILPFPSGLVRVIQDAGKKMETIGRDSALFRPFLGLLAPAHEPTKPYE